MWTSNASTKAEIRAAESKDRRRAHDLSCGTLPRPGGAKYCPCGVAWDPDGGNAGREDKAPAGVPA